MAGFRRDLKGSCKGDIDTDIDIDVEVDLESWLLKRGFKVSSGIVEWYSTSHGIDIENSERASPAESPLNGVLGSFKGLGG